MPEQINIGGNTYTLGATVGPVSGTGGSTSYFFNNLVGGQTYYFVVVAYNYSGFSGYAGPVSVYKPENEQRTPIYGLVWTTPYMWRSSGGVFVQSHGSKNILAFSNDLSVENVNFPSDPLNTGPAKAWDRLEIQSVENGFNDPIGGTSASKITVTTNPSPTAYSRFFQLQQDVKPNTAYTYSFWTNTTLTSSNFNYAIYNTTVHPDSGYVFIDGGAVNPTPNNGWVKTTKSFTTGVTQYGVAIYALNRDFCDGAVAYLWGLQLEEGLTATSFEITKGHKEFGTGLYDANNTRVYQPDINLWANYYSSIGATYLSPMTRPPFGVNTSRNLTTFMDGWTLSYMLKRTAQELSLLPEGLRVIASNNFDYGQMLEHTDDKITVNGMTGIIFVDDDLSYDVENNSYYGSWNDGGINLYKQYWAEMLDALYAYGGSVDQVHQDNEYSYSLMWALDGRPNRNDIVLAYVNDNRYKTQWRGMPSWESTMATYGATASYIFNYGDIGFTSYTIWNYVVGKNTGKVFDEIFYQTTKLKNPNVLVSNYNYFQTDAAAVTNKITDAPPDGNGHPNFNDNVVGNASAPYLYGELSLGIAGPVNNTVWLVRPSDPTRFDRFFPQDGIALSTVNPSRWTRMISTLQTIRSIKRANPQNIITPWISSVNYPSGYIQDLSGVQAEAMEDKVNIYYEVIRHMGVSGVKHFLWWNDFSISWPGNIQTIQESHFKDLSDVLGEINTRIGGSTPIAMVTERISWLAEYIISGAPAESGGYWWRATPKPGKTIIVNGTTIDSSTEVGAWIYTESGDIPSVTVLAPG